MKEAMILLFIVCSLLSVSNYMMQDDINEIKQDITELRKVYGYE